MKTLSPTLLLAPLLATLATLATATAAPLRDARQQWQVDGVTREALVSVPASAKTEAAPLVFVFHGHGGTMAGAARSFHIHDIWPGAIVVYPQGLKTPGMLTDPQGKRSGWQSKPGDQDDRDLKFFDVMLAGLSSDYKVDPARIYSTGHSNGGGFTYLLWATRDDRLAAVAPSSAAGARKLRDTKPLPAMHIAGSRDRLVKFKWQQLAIAAIKKLNRCQEKGESWAENATLFPSATGTPVVTVVHPGGHKFYAAAPELIVRFFKGHQKG